MITIENIAIDTPINKCKLYDSELWPLIYKTLQNQAVPLQ
jgi:hypothetical protein